VKKYSKEDQKLMAAWAADCAERVLTLFEKEYPEDDRPRKAIEACRTWVGTGIFKMAEIRLASLSSHAAAREVKENDAACFAARAAGQAVATAHVPQHAYGGAIYALKAIAAADRANSEVNISREREWQAEHLPEHLRKDMLPKIVVKKRKTGFFISVNKEGDF
jgi:hypothetical protein